MPCLLARRGPLGHIWGVHRYSIIRYLLTIFVIVGLMGAGSLTVPTPASAMSAASMADSMLCCPKKHFPDDCHKCPLGVLCVSPGMLGAVNEFSTPFFPIIVRVTTFQADRFRDGLGFSPPSRPPRILV